MTTYRTPNTTPFGPPSYPPNELRVYRGGGGASGPAGFDPATLFGAVVGDWWEVGDLSSMFTDSAGTIPVTADGDPVGKWVGKNATWSVEQATTGSKPIYSSSEKAISCFDGKHLTAATPLLLPVGVATDITIFAHFRRSGVEGVGNSAYIACTRYNGYANAVGFNYASRTFVQSGNVAPYYTSPALPAETAMHSLTYIQAAAQASMYTDDEPTQRLQNTVSAGAITNPGGAGDTLLSYTDEPGRYYHMKMALMIRRALTLDEIADLHAYAVALP